MNPIHAKDYFYLGQFALIALIFGILLFVSRPKTPASGFKVREADRKKQSAPGGLDFANAKYKTGNTAFMLSGVRIDAAPFEILGISSGASVDEIQKAYRDLMKQY